MNPGYGLLLKLDTGLPHSSTVGQVAGETGQLKFPGWRFKNNDLAGSDIMEASI